MSATIGSGGGSLVSYEGDTTIDIPAGTLSDDTELTHAPATGMPAPAGLAGTGQVFDITAIAKDSGEPAQPEPGHSFTLTVQYPESVPTLEETLALYFWDGSQWVYEPTSTRNPATNTVRHAGPLLDMVSHG